ncbi:MAG TPA: hypothetical protein VMT62_16415 [Syntrophorhabdaceae bacterium]|nr:hypothetical protein [Syntrophorhabdaceae bacterium]
MDLTNKKINLGIVLGIISLLLVGCASRPTGSGVSKPGQNQVGMVAHAFGQFVSIENMTLQVKNPAGTLESYQLTEKTDFVDQNGKPMSMMQFKDTIKAGDDMVVSADFSSKTVLTVRLGKYLPIRFGN